MAFKNFRWNMLIRSKLVFALLIVVIPTYILSGAYTTILIQNSLEKNIDQSLRNASVSISNMVKTTATASVKNYLRAVAEKNLDIGHALYARHVKGEMRREEFIDLFKAILLSQRIGRTGYIYCVNSKGVAAVHPHDKLIGQQYLDRPFVREQIRKKTGYLEYYWKNPNDPAPRSKALYMSYFKPLDWIISVTTYRNEFAELIRVNDFRESVSALKFSETGYAFITDREGKAILHPTIEGKSILTQSTQSKADLAAIIRQKSGKIHYWWQNPDESRPREKVALFNFIPDLEWVVGSSTYLEEVLGPVYEVRRVILFAIVMGGVLTILMIFFLAGSFAGRLKKLQRAFLSGMDGNYTIRLTPKSNDEIGQLTNHFNRFMDRLEHYQSKILDEISERKRAESELRDSETKYRQLFEIESDAIFLVDKKSNRILETNTSATQLYGYTPEELENTRFVDLFADPKPQSKSTSSATTAFPTIYHRNKNGDIFPIEIKKRCFEWREKTIEVCSVRDLSSKIAAEEQKRLLSMAVEQANDIIVITDMDASIQYVNPAFTSITGYEREEVIGKNPRLLNSGRHNQLFYQNMWETLLRGKTWKGQITNKKKDGSLFIENAVLTPLLNENGEITNIVAAKRDVTREVGLENQLLQSQKMEAVGSLAGGIAHDFNNILGGIFGFSELALSITPHDQPELKHYLSRNLEACERAKDLVQQILTFSRQGKRELKTLQLKLLVDETLQLLRASLPATIEIRKNLKSNAFVMADPTNMHQVVMNLCTNAFHAMKNTGGVLRIDIADVAISAEEARQHADISPGPHVRVTVSDTGVGMPPHVMERIFDPFFTTKPKGEGTGLGLSVVHGIIRRSGGDISVQSQPGKGTTYDILLPAVAGERAGAPEEAKSLPRGTERILFVDDEPFLVETSEQLMRYLGYRVTSTASPREALAYFKKNPDAVDLVITDLTMPEMTGDKLALELLKIRGNLPIIICSGFSETKTEQQYQKMGIKGLLKKPVVISDLATIIRNTLDGSSAPARPVSS